MYATFKKLPNLIGFELHRTEPDWLVLQLEENNITTVFDVGAYKGTYARMLLGGGFKGRIISFEPLPEAHAYLLETSKATPLWEIAERTAIGEKEGTKILHVSKNKKSSSFLKMRKEHTDAAPSSRFIDSIEVPTHTLEWACKTYARSKDKIFLKLDVQGYEHTILESAQDILNRLFGVQIECSLTPLYKGEKMLEEMILFMKKRGFELHDLIPGFRHHTTGRLLQSDCVFFRKI